ncbi:MAG: transposase [Deltaproteobacteria bacterium]|nr:transposase [Deltaproteobacteria bacterium]
MQRKAVAYLRARREHGASIEEVAREIGVTKGSLYRWQREPKQTRATQPALRPVQVMAALKPAAAIVVRGPRGILIEGLDIGGIAELLAKVST